MTLVCDLIEVTTIYDLHIIVTFDHHQIFQTSVLKSEIKAKKLQYKKQIEVNVTVKMLSQSKVTNDG